MSLAGFYQENYDTPSVENGDFMLLEYKSWLYVGFDSEKNLCVAIESTSNLSAQVKQRTKMVSVECNTRIKFSQDIDNREKSVHIIRCYSRDTKEHILFLELIESMISAPSSDEDIIDIFSTLVKFFADQKEASDAELIGLYAEIDAILSYPSLKLADKWQSKDRLKFDFSFSDKVKLEVKATTKPVRGHHFRHEQLVTELYEIYILSYMLRYDDEGISLFDHIVKVKPLLEKTPQQLKRINLILKNVSEDRLKNMRFNPEYTADRRHFYDAKRIPRFTEFAPEGVANAEYDCSLENIGFLTEEEFVQRINNVMEANNGASY